MSQRPKDRKIRGRYNGPVPTSNFSEGDDFFDEPFSASDAAPRSYGPGALAVVDGGIDMCLDTNKANHHTSAYDTPNLVVRRGKEFLIRVTFNRPPTEADDYQLEFLIGESEV
ncbi:divergent protein kinase domain 1C [Scomber scombrus]|uniref:Divergent protein kinase domain 1C n=1 Tax=Scomber scombrus TaxID=13677 RepID=A0AAV1QKH7_SCOSC